MSDAKARHVDTFRFHTAKRSTQDPISNASAYRSKVPSVAHVGPPPAGYPRRRQPEPPALWHVARVLSGDEWSPHLAGSSHARWIA